MQPYHKIQTIFHRDPITNNKTLLEGQWSDPAFEYLALNRWIYTEKIDGTNIRVMWDGCVVTFGGKTNNAQIPANLVNRLQDMFPARMFADNAYPAMTLYGEGYGKGIQKGGGNYISDGVDFILFDVFIYKWWLGRENIEDIASHCGIKTVPIIGEGTLHTAYVMAREGFMSHIADIEAEGIVMRPKVALLNRSGHRIITKIKHSDFRVNVGIGI